MTRTARAGALAAGALTLACALTGCLGPTPTATPDAAPPTPSTASVPELAETADPLESVTAIVLRPEYLELRDAADATVQDLSYDLPAEEFAAALSAVFGTDPLIEEYGGSCCEARPATRYHWEDFTVADDHMGSFADDDHSVWVPDDGPDYVDMNLSVRVTERDVLGIAVTTTGGFRVGDDVAELAARLGQPYGAMWFEIAVETGPELGPPEVEGRMNAYSVVVQGPAPEANGVRLAAPVNIGVDGV